MNILAIRRFRKVLAFAWKDAQEVSVQTGRMRLSIYIDIVLLHLRYSINSIQYVKKGLWKLSEQEKIALAKSIGEDNKRHDAWAITNYRNWQFLKKYTDLKYECSPALWEKRRQAYTNEFNAGPGLNVQFNVHIHREHYQYGTITIGRNVLLAKNVFIDYTGNVVIGDDVSISNDAVIESHEHLNHGDPSCEKKEIKLSNLRIDRGAFIGSRASILGSCHHIGRYSRVGANSVVMQDVPPYAVVQGNPAKIVGFVYNTEQIIDFELNHLKEEDRLGFDEIDRMMMKYRYKNETHRPLENDLKDTSVLDKVHEIVSSILNYNLSPEDDSLPMSDIDGWGSLANMSIIAQTEETFGIHFSSDELYNMTSVTNISKIVESKLEDRKETLRFDNIANLYEYSPLWKGICKNIEVIPTKVAVKFGQKTLSYSQLYEGASKAAQYLYDKGIRKGDKIILSAQKNFDFICFYFASHIIGSVNIILDSESNEERKKLIEDKVEPKICVGYLSIKCDSILYESTHYHQLPMLKRNEENTIEQNDISEILFTTGTTGQPKGVCLSFANIYGSASNINEFIQNTEDDKELIGLPICHSFAMGRLRCNLLKGATIIFVENFANVRKFFDVLEQEGCTGFGMVPAVWSYISKASGDKIAEFGKQLRYIEIGSAAMPIKEKENLLKLLPKTRICMHYGLTEASRTTFLEFHDTTHLSSIGKPSSSQVSLKVFDADGNELLENEEGELCVAGNMVLSRYLEDVDNNQAYWGKYFRTGDRGYKDKDGYFYLVGRDKEMINVGGKKVSPIEVEDAIISLGVDDCVCVGINDKNGILGEVVKAFILRDGTILSFSEISERLSTMLEPYKIPVEYEWIDAIPQTASGKKKRLSLSK